MFAKLINELLNSGWDIKFDFYTNYRGINCYEVFIFHRLGKLGNYKFEATSIEELIEKVDARIKENAT